MPHFINSTITTPIETQSSDSHFYNCSDSPPCLDSECELCSGYRFGRGLVYGSVLGILSWVMVIYFLVKR